MVNRTQKPLWQYQLDNKGQPYSLDEFCCIEQGRRPITEGQAKLEAFVHAGISRNIFTLEIYDLVKDKKNKIEDAVINRLNDPKSALKKIYAKSSGSIPGFIQKISGLASYRVLVNQDEKGFRKKVVNFVKGHFTGKGNAFIKEPDEQINHGSIGKFMEDSKVFLNGQMDEYDGEKILQYGFNDAQKLIKSEIFDLNKKARGLEDKIKGNPFFAIEKKPADEGAIITSMKRKKIETGPLKKEYNQLKAEYAELSSELIKWQNLYNSTELFRQELTPFENKLWAVFDKKYSTKEIPGGEVVHAMHPMQLYTVSPYVEAANELLGDAGKVISSGEKTPDSTENKISRGKYKGNTSHIEDSVRLTIALKDLKGVGLFISNMEDIAKENDLPIKADVRSKVYDSFFIARTLHMVVPIETTDRRGKMGTQFRVGEVKIVSEGQMAVKRPYCDKLYDICDKDMKPENEKEVNVFIDSESLFNKVKVQNIHDKLTMMLDDKYLQGIIIKNKKSEESKGPKYKTNDKFGFGFDISNVEEFKKQKNFENAYDKLRKIERLVFLEPLSKASHSVKKDAYDSFMQKMAKGKFNAEDYAVFESAFTEEEIAEYVKSSVRGAVKQKGFISHVKQVGKGAAGTQPGL